MNGVKIKNIEGNKYNSLTVIRFVETDAKYNRLFECLCDCGNTLIVRGVSLISSHTKSCGCLRKGIKRKTLSNDQSLKNGLISRYKKQANDRGLSWELSNEEAVKLFSSNCYYCGIEPLQIFKRARYNKEFIYNGIDRLENNEGYCKFNTVACCKTCNYAKREMSFSKFNDWIQRIINHNKK